MDRDLNAAINIKAFGLEILNRTGTVRIYACGDSSIGDLLQNESRYVSMKQKKFLTFSQEAVVSLESQ